MKQMKNIQLSDIPEIIKDVRAISPNIDTSKLFDTFVIEPIYLLSIDGEMIYKHGRMKINDKIKIK